MLSTPNATKDEEKIDRVLSISMLLLGTDVFLLRAKLSFVFSNKFFALMSSVLCSASNNIDAANRVFGSL